MENEAHGPDRVLDVEPQASQDSAPGVLYHYTDAAGLLGILEYRELWATETRCMNDAQEVEYAARVVAEDLRTFGERALREMGVDDVHIPNAGEDLADWARRQSEDLQGDITAALGVLLLALSATFKETVANKHRVGDWLGRAYAACFTGEPDSLGQWRGYAGGSGYAIGFDSARIAAAPSKKDDRVLGRLQKVGYGEAAAREVTISIFENLAEQAQEAAKKVKYPLVAGVPILRIEAATPDPWVLATVKHEAFESEKEWRLIFAMKDGEDSILHDFRPGGVGGILPYLKVTVPDAALVSVTVGPGEESELRKLMVGQALRRFGYRDVEVLGSSAPYRP